MTVTTTYAAEFFTNVEIAANNVATEIIGLADGGLAGLGADGPSVGLRIFNAELQSIGSTSIAGANGALDQLSNGNIVLASESGGTLSYRIVDAAGDEVRATTALGDLGLTVNGVAALKGAGAGFVVAVTDLISPGDNDVEIKVFDAEGNEGVGIGFVGTAPNEYGAQVAALNDGGFAVAWTRELVGGATQVWHAVYNGDGSVRTVFDAVDNAGSVNRNVAMVSLANGGYAIAYEDSSWTGGVTEVTVAHFSAAGAFQGSVRATTAAGSESEIALARLANGMLALSFTTDVAGNQDIGMQLLSADAATALMAVPQSLLDGPGARYDSNLAAYGSGGFALSSSGEGADTHIYRLARTSASDAASDSITGDDLVDRMSGGDGGDTLSGLGADDELLGENGFDVLDGGFGDDTLEGGNNPDTLIGGQNDDVLDAGGGSDSVTGGAGDDFVLGSFGPDTMVGGPGNDTLFYFYMPGETFLDLGNSALQNTHSAGNDTLIGFENATTGDGDDRVLGSGQANLINTQIGADTIKAADGADTIGGGDGADKLNGGGGADWVSGGGGADRMLGGRDADLFIYNSVSDSGLGADRDIIRDFRTADGDKIFLSMGLTYIGDTAFDGSGPQVRVAATAEGQLVQVDTDGGGTADMEILIRNSGMTGGASDFEL